MPPLRTSPWDSLNGKYVGHGTVDRGAPSSFISESLFAERTERALVLLSSQALLKSFCIQKGGFLGTGGAVGPPKADKEQTLDKVCFGRSQRESFTQPATSKEGGCTAKNGICPLLSFPVSPQPGRRGEAGRSHCLSTCVPGTVAYLSLLILPAVLILRNKDY